MSHVALLVLFAADPASTPSISDVVEEVMASSRDAVIVAVQPIDVDDATYAPQARLAEKELVRALVDRGREQVVSSAYLRAHSDAHVDGPTSAHGADHVLVGIIEREDHGGPVLRLRLIFSETGEVLASSSTPLSADARKRAIGSARGVRAAVDELVADIAWSLEETGEELRVHRTAVMPVRADDDARSARLHRLIESELTRALVARGLLVVERASLDAAIAQQGDASEGAPQLGQMLGAQSLVMAGVAVTGATFTVSVSVLSTSTGQVIGASSASLPREAVVAMADVEMRTPFEAGVRSAVAPGWGQAYNRRDDKALLFALAAYGSLATTAGLGVSGALLHARYEQPGAFDDVPPADRAKAATDMKSLADGLYVSAIVAGAVAVSVWSWGIVDAIVDAPTDSGRGAE